MIVNTTWSRVRGRLRRSSSGRDEGLRGVAFKLAAQTVILVLVMLMVLEGVVYVITQHALLGSLEATLRTRARDTDPTVCAVLHLSCGFPGIRSGTTGPPEGQRGPGRGSFPSAGPFRRYANLGNTNSSEGSAVYVDAQLRVLDGHGVLGPALLDTQDARQVIRTGDEHCCSVRAYQGQDFLVYTKPLRSDGTVVGAVQTSVSEYQYTGTMESLLQNLLMVAVLGLLIAGGISIVLVRRALEPIRRAIQRQRDFVADAAHELRTPLAIMRTVGEVGLSDPSPEELQATIAQMLGENQHLTRLVEDLSLLARTDTDAMALERHPVDLSSLVADTTAELRPLAEAQGVTFETDVRKDVWGIGDILRLRQLLLILLDNALKHTPAGGQVAIRLFLQGDRARLQVTDSGPGIATADLPRIFDRFYRADKARVGEGSGLGLAIGKWIAEAHAGQIGAGNSPDRGAVFTVTLPLARAAARVQSPHVSVS